MDFDEMARIMDEGLSQERRLIEGVAPVLADMLCLGDTYELAFEETSLAKTSTRICPDGTKKTFYELKMIVGVKGAREEMR